MRKKIVLIFMLALAFATSRNAWAQLYDSTFYPQDSTAIYYFKNNLDTYSQVNLQHIDTTLIDFEEYDPVEEKYKFYASLGNVGLAYRNQEFTVREKTGFDYGINTFDIYFFDQNEIKYYLNPKPYTEIGYVTGAKKEQLFHASHAQRVYKRLALGVDFDLINSLGSYQRQKSDNTRVAATAQFFTDDLRYGVISNYTHGKVKVRENGGIKYDSIYEQNIETNRSIIDINLQNAENQLRESGVYLQQYFQLSHRKRHQIPDSIRPQRKKIQLRFGRISHSFNYKRYSQVYTDLTPNADYYPNIYYDSVFTYDSVFFRKMENTFSWSNADYIDRLKPQPLLLMFGIKHQLAEVNDTVKSSSFTSLIPYGELRITPFNFFDVRARANYVLTGEEYQGDYHLFGLATLEILRRKPYKTSFNFELQLDKHAAPYFYQHYFSNHFIWDNDFSRVKTNRISGYIKQRNLKIGADLIDMKDYIYIGTDTLPAQYGSNIRVFKAYFDQLFRFGKFDVNTRILYQKSSAEDVLRVPELAGYFTITFNLELFKGALDTRSGFDLFYFTEYYADKYMPAIRSFYLQNEKKIGGFLHADFFIDFTVKRTRFFMKLQNFLSAVGENYYYQVPHYPMQDMAFKFGLSWRFHD